MACRSKTLLAFNGRQNGRVNGARGDGIDGNKVATTVQKNTIKLSVLNVLR